MMSEWTSLYRRGSWRNKTRVGRRVALTQLNPTSCQLSSCCSVLCCSSDSSSVFTSTIPGGGFIYYFSQPPEQNTVTVCRLDDSLSYSAAGSIDLAVAITAAETSLPSASSIRAGFSMDFNKVLPVVLDAARL